MALQKLRIKLSVAAFSLRFCNVLLSSMQRVLYARPGNPTAILIFRTGSLGDNLCAIPSISAIRAKFPQARIDILTNAGKANLVTLEKILPPAYYDRIIDYFGYSRRSLISLLRQGDYDTVIYLPQVDASLFTLVRDLAFFRFFAGSGFGWTKSMIPLFRRTQERSIVFPNEISRLAGIMTQNDIPVARQGVDLNNTEEDERLVKDYFIRNGLTDKRKNIALVMGAKRPQNRWPLSNFKTVAGHFHHQYNILLIGGPEDRALAEPLAPMDRVYDLCGKFTPIQSSLALRNCLLTLSNDTGPMHLSYAVGTPTIALFSSRDLPGKWYPPDSPFNLVFRTGGVACAACFSETCNDNICMKAIKPTVVIGAMEAMIKTLSN